MTRYDDIRALFESHNQLDRFETAIKESCSVVMRQTDYDEETANLKLIEHDLNVMAVVKEYLGIKDIVEVDNRTTNQKVFGEFRKFLDDASTRFYQQRELEKQKQAQQQQMMQFAAAQSEERRRQHHADDKSNLDPIQE